MEIVGTTEKAIDPGLPLASLRLLVPPLQLLSAAMWQLAKQKDVMSYDKLQEFVFMVTEAVPGLINHRQRAQLILGLRARLVLELCKGSDRGSVDSQLVQNYLEQLPINSDNSDAEVKTIEYTFIALVQSLLKDPAERAYFFQEIFPVEYGTQYDAALLVLMWEFLSKLEKLLPVPDLKQTAAWLASTPSALEECVQSSPEELSLIFQQYMGAGMLKIPHGPSSNIGSCIMSALSIPPSQKSNISVGLDSIHSYASIISPVTLVDSDQYSIVAVYTEGEGEEDGAVFESAEVQVHPDFCENEIVAVTLEDAAVQECDGPGAEATGEAVDVAKALETLTRTFALRKETISQDGVTGKNRDFCDSDTFVMVKAASDEKTNGQEEIGFHADNLSEATEEVKGDFTAQGDPESQLVSSVTEFTDSYESSAQEKVTDDDSDAPISESRETFSPAIIRRSSRLQVKTSHSWQEVQTCKRTAKEAVLEHAMNEDGVSAAPTVIAIKGLDKGDSEETTSIIFTCSQCPFHRSPANSPPHFHMQSIPTEEYKTLSGAKVTPSPCSTDEIFTSIKLFPKENQQQIKAQDDNKRRADVAERHGKHKCLRCETCGKTFTRTSDVKRHQLTHTGERPFHCSRCERTFQHSWDLAKHESKDHGVPISFSCPLCRSSFSNLRALTLHHKKSHSQESQLPHICSICSKSFAGTSEYLEHRKSHVSSKCYICRLCGEGFDSVLARSQHRQVHQVKHPFKCPHCEKSFTRRSDVKRHLSTHTGECPYQCNLCNKRFALRFMLTKHLRVHSGERPFQCSHCPKKFTLVSVLARHERMHTGEKPFLCSQCGKGFKSQGELSKHQRSHVDDKPYPCPQCDKCFKTKKTQQEHIVSHTGARPYPCTYCGKGFAKPYALTRHNLIHTGERPFSCGHCEKSFLTLSEAQLHERIHTGEKPYPCNICDFKFKSSSELARHKRTHAGLRPAKLQCEQCTKCFTSRTKLERHMETHREDGSAAEFDKSDTSDVSALTN